MLTVNLENSVSSKPLVIVQDINVDEIPDDDYESLKSAGIAFRESGDRTLWGYGHLASKVKRGHGEKSLARFAYDIGLTRKDNNAKDPKKSSAIYAHLAVWEKFGHMSDALPALSHSHYRMLTSDDIPMDKALDLLRRAADGGWSENKLRVERNREIGAPVPPKKIVDDMAFVVGTDGDTVVLRFPEESAERFTDNAMVRVKVYETDTVNELPVSTPPIRFTARVVTVGACSLLLAVTDTTAFAKGAVYKFSATITQGDE